MKTRHIPPAELAPGDHIPALDDVDAGGPYIVGAVELVDAPHPHTRRRPHWCITDAAGGRPRRYDADHRAIVSSR